MKTRITCVLILAFCLSLVGSSSGEIFIGNAEFEDEPLLIGEYTYNIAPWQWANAVGDWPAWISYGYYGDEPEPLTPLLFTSGSTVYQSLSATYVDGGTYEYSLDVAVYYGSDDWELFLYDATAGDYSTPLVSRASTDPGEAQIDLLTWTRKSLTFTATAAEAGHQIGVGVSGWEWTMFDNVALEIPITAYGPDPYDGEINVLVNKTLSWYAGRDPDPNFAASPNPDITQHMLYMSSGSPTDPNVSYVTSIAAGGNTGEYTPAVELDREATYYWRIDERLESDENVITGDVWMFETVGTSPFIDDATPADALVDAGDDAVFTVVAVNPFTSSSADLNYQWYKVGEPDEMLSNGAGYSGVQTESLTVLDARFADSDEGQYYCVVTNTSGNTDSATSRSAWLSIRSLVGHWKLDETSGTTAADSSGGSNTGTVIGAGTSPAWTTGIDGGALGFDGDDTVPTNSDYVDCGSDISLKPAQQVTVSGWYNTDNYRYYGQIAGFAFDEGANESGYSIVTEEGGWIGFWISGSSGSGTYLWTSDVPAGPTGWTHVAGTYDGTTMRLYINGAEKATSTNQSGNINYDHVNSFRVGLNESGSWWLPYEGDIDDVRVYNYVLDQYEIAQSFIDFMPDETICLSYPAMDISGPDGEPDCVVGIFDFVLIASQWMQCNLLPDCL